jgi:hypothetical protein
MEISFQLNTTYAELLHNANTDEEMTPMYDDLQEDIT